MEVTKGEAIGSQNTKAWIDWKHAEGTVLVYGIHFPTGHVRADAVFKAKSGKHVTFGIRIVHPATGTVVLENTATSSRTTTAEQTMEVMPDTEMPYDGWYRFELTCPNGTSTLDRLNLLLFPTQRYSWHQAYTYGGALKYLGRLPGKATTGLTSR